MQPNDAQCPVCGARGFDLAGVFARPKHPHTMYRCRTCKVVVDSRIWAVDPQQDLAAQAAATEDCYTRTYTADEFARRIELADATLGEFSKFIRGNGCFVELGVGEGFLARAAAGRFPTAYGLDIDLTAAESVFRQFGCPDNLRFLRHGEFAPAETGPISVTALWHVLEHLRDPLAVLRPFLERMQDGGLVIGQVPLLREDYVFDEHFLFYNESSLFHLAAALGCAPILMQRDEANDFLSFCFRKQEAPARQPSAQAGPPPTLRSLGPPVLFVFGHQRSGTNLLMDTLAASIACDVVNEGNPAGFNNFRLRPVPEVARLVEASAPGCLMKPITESLSFREIMQAHQGSRAVFIIRNPLDVVPSFLTEFRGNLPSVAYETMHNYRWTRLRDAGVTLESWAEVDRVLDKYAGRFDARQDLPSVAALSWLLLHAALRGRGILGAAGCAVVDYDDLFDDGGALSRKIAPLFSAPVQIAPARRRRREAHFFSSSVDVELMKDCLDTYHGFRTGASVNV
jgi:hypothetical protein